MCLAIPGRVLSIGDTRPDVATAEVSGVRRSVNVSLLEQEGVEPGDWVLIHVGFAMSKIDEEEARLTLEYLEGIGQSFADELASLAESSIE
jgi:hydrogenase expression/formation protein HypC